MAFTPIVIDNNTNNSVQLGAPTDHAEYIHNFTNIPWDSFNEPPTPNHSNSPQLYHLLTIMGALIVGYYPHNTHTLGDHYIAWAPLTSEANVTIH